MTDSNKLCDKKDIICKVKKDFRLIKPRGKRFTHCTPSDYELSKKPGLDRVKYCNIQKQHFLQNIRNLRVNTSAVDQ